MPDSLSGLSTGAQITTLDVLPPPPKHPDSMLKRFPELAEYDVQWRKWVAETNVRLNRGTLTS